MPWKVLACAFGASVKCPFRDIPRGPMGFFQISGCFGQYAVSQSKGSMVIFSVGENFAFHPRKRGRVVGLLIVIIREKACGRRRVACENISGVHCCRRRKRNAKTLKCDQGLTTKTLSSVGESMLEVLVVRRLRKQAPQSFREPPLRTPVCFF